MRYLPVSLDTFEKKILILGGGFLALSALKSVIDTEAEIYMIADSFTKDIVKKSEESDGKIKLKEHEIEKDFKFMGFDYVLIATEDFELNEALEKRASARNMIYQRFDIFSKSLMSINKSVERGPLTFSLNSSRLNPTITDIIFEDLKKFSQKYNLEKLNILSEIRSELVRKNSQNIDEIISKLYESETINLSTFLEEMPEYKIEDLKSSEDLLNHIEKGSEINLERESSLEDDQIIKKNLDDAKNFSRDKDLDKSDLNLESFHDLDKFKKWGNKMIGYVGSMPGKVFSEKEFTLVKKVLASGETIDKHNHPGFTVLVTIVKGQIKVTLNDEEDREFEPGKVLKFDGENYIAIEAIKPSEFFVTLIKKDE